MQRLCELAQQAGHFRDKRETQQFSVYCKERGIELREDIREVARKRDMV